MCLLLLGLVCSHAQAGAEWLTVTGNPDDVRVDTVQVDPVAVKTAGVLKIMNVRVSRSKPRVNWEGVPYQSYESQVAFACREGNANYLLVNFYRDPLWRGQSHKTTDYTGNPRPMHFREAEPNPTERIIRAACRPNPG